MNNSIGFLKYDADYIVDGVFDARKSAQALLGFDEIMKYFVKKEAPELSNIDFTLPVKITKGSWETLIPDNIDELIKLVGSSALLGTYLIGLAKKAAKDGLLETGIAKDIKKIFQSAAKAIQWCIKIRKHIKDKKVTEQLDRNTDSVILDVDNEKLSIPVDVYLIYRDLPIHIFDKIASVIDEDTKMTWGVKDDDGSFAEEDITISHRYLFYSEKDDTPEILFPEMIDGETVELQGEITRNNNKTNTIGFEYLGHILTCIPYNKASLTTYKDKIISKSDNKFFTTATIIGIVDRSENNGLRPKIKFTDIIPNESQVVRQQDLFQ